VVVGDGSTDETVQAGLMKTSLTAERISSSGCALAHVLRSHIVPKAQELALALADTMEEEYAVE